MDREQTPQERARELVRLLVPDWRPTTRQALWVIRIAIVLGVLITIGYSYGITLWDWAKLLIVPAVLAAGGVWFNQQQRERELQIAEQRAQDEALQGYLEQISHLLTDKERPLRRAKPGDDLSTVARARTLTVLPRLDRERKRSVMQFLYESGLTCKDSLVLDMSEADLRGAYLIGANLIEADLTGADLTGADLSRANVSWATLTGADLSGADLIETYLSGAYLSGGILRETNLSGARLSEGNLSKAVLSGAELRDTLLSRADLSGVLGATNDELEQQAYSLDGATMPNGQKYEETGSREPGPRGGWRQQRPFVTAVRTNFRETRSVLKNSLCPILGLV